MAVAKKLPAGVKTARRPAAPYRQRLTLEGRRPVRTAWLRVADSTIQPWRLVAVRSGDFAPLESCVTERQGRFLLA
jgi:hypothetical protein